jgi:putative zinc finger/helix-turn-helix YgiT family protein
MTPTDGNNLPQQPEAPYQPECPDCESPRFSRDIQEQRFLYGSGAAAVELSCKVPVCTCLSCGYQWTTGEAEDIRHGAVCRHLKRLTPAQVLDLRERHGLSQAEFSRITGFGEASLSRWETAAQIQNTAADRLLRLIEADPVNLTRLRNICDFEKVQDPKFRIIEITPERRRQAETFQLRGKSVRKAS